MSPDGESGPETAVAPPPASTVMALSSPLPNGSDPDAVRDWFELETIVDLPAPAISFAAAEAAAADYRRAARADNTRRGAVKLAESRLGRDRVGRLNGRDDNGSRPDLRRLSLPRRDH